MNLRTAVIAADISNLTDARYFAAWGVDYMSYNIDDSQEGYIGEEGIKEIIDWVEGPTNLGQLTGISVPPSATDLYNELGLQGLICGPFVSTDDVYDFCPKVWKEISDMSLLAGMQEELLIIKLPTEQVLKEAEPILAAAATTNEIYLDGVTSIEILSKLMDTIKPAGIVLRGGEEEKVGFKSYDELDQFFEWLEID